MMHEGTNPLRMNQGHLLAIFVIHLDHFFDEPSFFVEDVDPWRGHFPVDQQRHPYLRHRLKMTPNTAGIANSR